MSKNSVNNPEEDKKLFPVEENDEAESSDVQNYKSMKIFQIPRILVLFFKYVKIYWK